MRNQYAVHYVNWRGQWTEYGRYRTRTEAKLVCAQVRRTVALNGRASIFVV